MEFGALTMRLILAALSLVGAFAQVDFAVDITYRVPKNFKPISYTLDITTHLEGKFAFEGVVSIKMVCLESFPIIVLNAVGLSVDKDDVKIVDSVGKPVVVSNVWFAPAVDKLYVSTARDFKPKDELVLTIPFAGNITDSLVGYYRSSYVDKSTNQTKWLAVTKFEPVYARRAFPCLDEPAFKATFKIKLRHDKKLTAVSNMNLTRTTLDPSIPNYVVDEFKESPPMSTYLVAYMVSDLASVNSTVLPHVHFRIFARKDSIGQTDYARYSAPVILRYYEEYFDEKYPSSKLDMVALPDFASGAMENWGLITYREPALLFDPTVGTIEDSSRVIRAIAHEIAHMWFGNMVTMKWWTDLWLNEGFATYVTSRAMEKLYPAWETFQLETAENFISILDLDMLRSSHPVSVSVSKPHQITQIFDQISYKKGAYLLHMIYLFLGKDTFKHGIRNYIKKYKYANAAQDHLWRALTDEAHERHTLPERMSLKEIMDTWTLQTGYPVVKVIRDYNAGTANFSQERYLAFKSNLTLLKTCWWIPLTMTTSSELDFSRPKAHTWLNCESKVNTMKLDKTEPWVMLNIQMSGLYRVMYDINNWWSISNTLNNQTLFKKIHVLNRAQLIDDSLAFAKVGDLHYAITFQLMSYLKYEKEYIPWMVAIRGLSPLNRLLKRTPNYGIYAAYMRRILTPVFKIFEDMTIELNDFEAIRFKNLVISQACYYRIKECSDQAKELFKKWMESPDPDTNNLLPRELRSTIYCQAAKYGGEEAWNFLWKRYELSNVAAEKSKILVALGCTTDTYLLHRYLNSTIGEHAIIRKQDAFLVFHSVANNDLGYYLAKEFLLKNIKEISRYFHPRGDRVGQYLEVIGNDMKSKKELDQFREFIEDSKKYLKGTEFSVERTLEIAKENIKWTMKFYDKVTLFEKFLKL